MQKIELKKGDFLQREGDSKRIVYRVVSGLLRSYFIDDNGKEHIYMFAPENWIIGDNTPIDMPAQLFIDALEDTVVLEIEPDSPILLDMEKIKKRFGVFQNRIIKLMSSSGIERYEDFVSTYPDILQRVPQKMIASYLGITPEALSSVKSKRLKK